MSGDAGTQASEWQRGLEREGRGEEWTPRDKLYAQNGWGAGCIRGNGGSDGYGKRGDDLQKVALLFSVDC